MRAYAKMFSGILFALVLIGGTTGALISVTAPPADAGSGSNNRNNSNSDNGSDNSNSSNSNSSRNSSGNSNSRRSSPSNSNPQDNKGVSGLDLGSGRLKDD